MLKDKKIIEIIKEIDKIINYIFIISTLTIICFLVCLIEQM